MDKLVNSPDALIKMIRIYVDTFLELMHLRVLEVLGMTKGV